MAEYVQKGDNIEFVTDKAVGELVLVGSKAGIVVSNPVNGVAVVSLTGVWRFNTDAELTVGATAYVTPAGAITAAASGNKAVGLVVALGAGYADIRL